MGSSRSGSDIVQVRVEGGVVRPLPEEAIPVSDDAPWIDIGFSRQPRNDVVRELAARAGGSLVPSTDPPSHTLSWYRWILWSQPDQRRRGEFVIGGAGIAIVRAYVEMIRIFSDAEHQRMVDAIVDALDGAVWETRSIRPGVRASRKYGRREPFAHLIDNVDEELPLARSVLRTPAFELAPRRPGQTGLAGSPRLTYTDSLPENHVVGWWAAHRTRDLRRAELEVEELAGRRRKRADTPRTLTIGGKALRENAKGAVIEAEELLEKLRALLVRVSPMVRREPPNWAVIGPAITRDPRRRRLLEALRSPSEVAQIKLTAKLSRFQERTTAALFELWGAIAIVQSLQALGWEPTAQPRVLWIDVWSPERITWNLQRRDERIDVVFEPHADQPQLAPQTSSGALLSRLQRGGLGAAADSSEERLISVGASASPDYALIFRSTSGLALALGDATASDLTWLSEHNKWDWLLAKIRKVANDYAEEVCWWTPDGLTRCSRPASFVLLPGHESEWLRLPEMSREADRRGVVVLGARPRDASEGSPITLERLSAIVDTLRAHATDRSHSLPLTPGTAHVA